MGTTIDTATFADILTTKYDTGGSVIWQRTYSSAGYNRDQPVAVAVDDRDNIYVCGSIFSTATNFDIVVLKYKYDGTFIWAYTLNGSANSYDVPAAIKTKGNFVYVTGEVSDTNSLLNYVTFQLDRNTGALNWKHEYDYHNLYDVAFAMDISPGGNSITVSGASQNTPTKWDYCSIKYDSLGVAKDTTRIGGTANSFDRPTAVKSDHSGNFYVTGAASDSGASFNVRTAKIDSAGNLAWVVDFGNIGVDDEGNDLLVDDSGYVYVGGKSYPGPATKEDYLLVKYSNSGVQKWYRRFDANSADDEAVKMCFDNYGNIVMTGSATRSGKKDILTLAYNRTGDLQWKTYLNGAYNGDDRGTGIVCDANGNIYVTGQVQNTDSTWQQVTIKYKTDYFLVPQDTVPAPSSLLFYPNHGQIIDTNDSLREDVFYYTINQYPKLYFHADTVSFVMAHVDNDTATADTLERIAMTFVDGDIHKAPYTDVTHDTDQVLNYFLGHCPDGITGVTGSEKLMYSNVYEGIDVIFANNNAGMKFQIIINNGGEPGKVKLHFTGHHLLSIVNSSDLKIDGVLGSFTYERPLVYQLDGMGNRVSLGWLASYSIVDSADVVFALGGSYDTHLPLVFECAREIIQHTSTTPPPLWSTYIGGGSDEQVLDVVFDSRNADLYATGYTTSGDFPIFPSFQIINGGSDIFLSKFSYNGAKIYSTFYGGYGDEVGNGIAYDKDNSTFDKVYVVGRSGSDAVDTMPGHFPRVATSAINCFQVIANSAAACIIQFDASTGLPTWATKFPGYTTEFTSCSVAKDHSMFIGGLTHGYATGILSCFPDSFHPAYIPICDPGSGAYVEQYCNNRNVNLYQSGDGLILKFNNEGELKWSTLFGGENNPNNIYLREAINGVVVDTNNSFVYVTGYTISNTVDPIDTTAFCQAWTPSNFYHGLEQFPLCNPGGGAYFSSQLNNWNGFVDKSDAFIAKFSLNGNILWSTFFGSYKNDWANGIAVNSQGDVYIVGTTDALVSDTANCVLPSNYGFPHCATSPQFDQGQPKGGPVNYDLDAFVAKFHTSGQLAWSTVFGGYGDDIAYKVAVDLKDDVFICGSTESDYNRGNVTIPVYNAVAFPYQSINNDSLGSTDGFIGVFKSNEDQVVCTYWGGIGNDELKCIAAYGTSVMAVGGYSESYDTYPIQYAFPNGNYYQLHNASSSSGGKDGILTTFDIKPVVGVHEITKRESNFIIYPNPTQNSFYLETYMKESKRLIVDVTNYLGQTTKIYDLGKQSYIKKEINTNDLPNGIYFVRLISADDHISLGTKKIIIQK